MTLTDAQVAEITQLKTEIASLQSRREEISLAGVGRATAGRGSLSTLEAGRSERLITEKTNRINFLEWTYGEVDEDE